MQLDFPGTKSGELNRDVLIGPHEVRGARRVHVVVARAERFTGALVDLGAKANVELTGQDGDPLGLGVRVRRQHEGLGRADSDREQALVLRIAFQDGDLTASRQVGWARTVLERVPAPDELSLSRGERRLRCRLGLRGGWLRSGHDARFHAGCEGGQGTHQQTDV